MLAQLATQDAAVLHHHLPEHAADLLPLLARRLAELERSAVLLLTSESGAFAVVAGGSHDSTQLGRVVSEILDGRGGGRPPVFQGKATRIGRAAQAAERLRELLHT